jgi:hypothetical protein
MVSFTDFVAADVPSNLSTAKCRRISSISFDFGNILYRFPTSFVPILCHFTLVYQETISMDACGRAVRISTVILQDWNADTFG